MTTEMLTCPKCILCTQKDSQRQVSPRWLAVKITHLYLTTCCKLPGVHSAPQTQHTWNLHCTACCLSNSSFLFCLGLLRLSSPFPLCLHGQRGVILRRERALRSGQPVQASLLPALLAPALPSQGKWHTRGSKLLRWSNTVADTFCGTQADGDVLVQS